MALERISIRIPNTPGRLLRRRSLMKGKSESEVFREALETYLVKTSDEHSAYELAEEAGLIGCVRRAPEDLSTSRRHFDNFGNRK